MNYIGSKRTLVEFITSTILNVINTNNNNLTFADLFAGTGIVASEFKRLGYSVIANDIQYYSYVLNKHLIENNSMLDQNIFNYLNKLNGCNGFIYNNYCAGSGSGRNYFTDENGQKCDSVRIELENLKKQNQISDCDYYYVLASLINSIDKYANTASVYGAFLKHIKKSAAKSFILEPLPCVKSEKKCYVYNENINNLIRKISGDILYLDPPYNTRQYCTNYHLLETIAKYDNPIIHGKTGLREYSNQKSLYCSKRTVKIAFDDLIKNADFKYIFLSYNNEGIMSLDDIKNIMSNYGQYSVYMKEYKRFRADKEHNRNHKADSTIEYLHCLIK